MSNNDRGLPLANGENSWPDANKRAWERPALRRLAARQAEVSPIGPNVEKAAAKS